MSPHHDLASFLVHARQTGMRPGSTVFVGTHFEYVVRASLRRYGFRLARTGGRSDLGIDLVGTWRPPVSPSQSCPSPPLSFRALVQCKAGARRPTPSMQRELEGAFAGAPPGWRGRGVLGFLVAEGPATPGVRETLRRSKWPMGFMCCSADGIVSQILWNQPAAETGLEGLEVGVAYSAVGSGVTQAQAQLLQNGKPLPFVEEQVEEGEEGEEGEDGAI
jgi:hypothetical protein